MINLIDGKAVYPLKILKINELDFEKLDDSLKTQFNDEYMIPLYFEKEITRLESILNKDRIPYEIIEYSLSSEEANSLEMTFSSRSELLNYIKNNIKPSKTKEELEQEVDSLRDVVFTLMFGEMS